MRHVHTIVTTRHAQILDELAEKYGTKRKAIELALEALRKPNANLGIPESSIPYLESASLIEEKSLEQMTADIMKYAEMIRSLLEMDVVVLPTQVVDSLVRKETSSDEDLYRTCQQNARTFAKTFKSAFSDLKEPSWESFVKIMKILSNYNVIKNVRIMGKEKTLSCHLATTNIWPGFITNWYRTFLEDMGYDVDIKILDRRCIITLAGIRAGAQEETGVPEKESTSDDAMTKERELTKLFNESFYPKP
ncbi:MAG: hypothetical protein QMC78_05230 [Methanocellales archaeon]|nr:hypothetical protein [Methanocellales archaeon]